MAYVQKTICPYDCPTSCGLLAETDGIRIISMKGDPDHPASRGLICRKMQRYERSVHHPHRILTPLKRTGGKGEGKFTPISWEEAVAEISGRWKVLLEEEGGDSILPFYYSGVMSVIQRKCGDAFFNRMGACDLVRTLCSSAKGAGYESVMGRTGCLDPRELSHSDFFLVWGSNMKATRLQTMPILREAGKQGKRAVLIEVCARDMAPFCNETLLLKPGTDGALALALMHVLARDGFADEAFLRKYGEGYDAFKETLPSYTPSWAQEITGIPAEKIEALAAEYGEAKAPAIILGSGPSRHGNGGMTVRLITILSTFTGAWSRPGGGLCGCNPTAGAYVDSTLVTRPDFRKVPGRKVNINELACALNGREGEAPVKSLFVYGGNPVASVCSQREIVRGLLRPDLFTIVHERFMTDTARYADIVLPAAFSVEQTDCYTAYGYCTFGTARKIIPAPGQCKSNWDMFRMLAEAMGYGETYFRQTQEEMLQTILDRPLEGLAGISEREKRTLEEGGVISLPYADHLLFKTDRGMFKITDETLNEPMPRYIENNGGEFPLRLVAVPDNYTLNSIFLEREDLTDKKGPMTLFLHPEDGAIRGICSGDRIIAFNELAEVEFQAELTELVAKGAAAAQGVFACASSKNGWLVNALHHQRLSDMGAATTLNDNTIDVKKCV
ncbi:MAG: molybdopterin-dependent oxidoreductase [Clostridium sp.]|nr:molybdopterin-dependent oxidoreductase [Clostridium sp.]